jgi:hypothetical protein
MAPSHRKALWQARLATLVGISITHALNPVQVLLLSICNSPSLYPDRIFIFADTLNCHSVENDRRRRRACRRRTGHDRQLDMR